MQSDGKNVPTRFLARLRVAVLDDHPVVRTGLTICLSSELDFELTNAYSCRDALMEGLQARPADVVLLDCMPNTRPSDRSLLIHSVAARYPKTRILVFSAFADLANVSRSLRAGARGFVAKSRPIAELVNAIRIVAQGSVYIGVGRAHRAGQPSLDDSHTPDMQATGDRRGTLSAREKDVIRCYLEGMTVTEIAAKFHRSIKTISSQKSSALRKLGVSSKNDLFKILGYLDTL